MHQHSSIVLLLYLWFREIQSPLPYFRTGIIPRRVVLKERLLGQSPIERIVRRTQGKSTSGNDLIKNGWRMKEIDEMDMPGFLRLRAWDATSDQGARKEKAQASLH